MKNTIDNQLEFPGISEDLKKQRAYMSKLEVANFDFGLVIADAFVRGMRDIGYKSTATALNELIDNSIQAEAENVFVRFGFSEKNSQQKEPDYVAIVDDGHGMDPTMIRAAVLWGGTHRENDRTGFGRYGYGLPSACVSIGRKFTVYSKVTGGKWHEVSIDIDEIGNGKYNDGNGRPVAPKAIEALPPDWLKQTYEKLDHGTCIVISKVDRITYKLSQKLEQFLLHQFGIVYRNYIRQLNLIVNETIVEPIDPLFITPGYRYYDEDDDRAESLPSMIVEVKDEANKKILGIIKARFSYMPPTFLRKAEYKPQPLVHTKEAMNRRFSVRKEHNGIIVLRKGRQIDIVKPDWTTFQNYDRNIGVEIDFEPTLDEYFRITTSKQQIIVDDKIWQLLKNAGFNKAIESLRGKFREYSKVLIATPESSVTILPSESVMEEAEKFKTRKPAEPTPEQRKKIEENFDKEAKRRAQESGVILEEVKKILADETSKKKYKIERESIPNGWFFRVEQVGGQKVLYLNTAHSFFKEVYAGPESTPRLRATLELLLFVIGECHLESTADRNRFYSTEMTEWSSRLETALNLLSQRADVEDALTAKAEAEYVVSTESAKLALELS